MGYIVGKICLLRVNKTASILRHQKVEK